MTEKILEKLSEQAIQLARIDERLKAYNESLDEHIRRTELLEKEVHELWRYKWAVAGGLAVVTFAAQFIIKNLMR
jgi:hypothetical protein